MREAGFSKDDPHNFSHCYYYYYYHHRYNIYPTGSFGSSTNGKFNSFSFYSKIKICAKKSHYQGIDTTNNNDITNNNNNNNNNRQGNTSLYQAPLYFKYDRYYLHSYHDIGRKLLQALYFGNSTNSWEKLFGLILFLFILKNWFLQFLLPRSKRNPAYSVLFLEKDYFYKGEPERNLTVNVEVDKQAKILDLLFLRCCLGCECYCCTPIEICCGPSNPHRSMPSWEYSNVCRCIEDSNQFLHCCFLPPVFSAVQILSKVFSFACNLASIQSRTSRLYVLAHPWVFPLQ